MAQPRYYAANVGYRPEDVKSSAATFPQHDVEVRIDADLTKQEAVAALERIEAAIRNAEV